jgi:hypothetical protein
MGSVGIVANADVILSIQRQRGESEAVLFCEGNDIESKQLALQFKVDPLGFTLSDAAPGEIGQTQERRAILDALRELGGTARPGQIATLLGKNPKNVSKLLLGLKDDGLVSSTGYGEYSIGRTSRSSGTATQIYTKQEDKLLPANSLDGRTGRTEKAAGEPSIGTSTTSTTSTTSPTSFSSPAVSVIESKPINPPKVRIGRPAADWPASLKNSEDGDGLGIF